MAAYSSLAPDPKYVFRGGTPCRIGFWTKIQNLMVVLPAWFPSQSLKGEYCSSCSVVLQRKDYARNHDENIINNKLYTDIPSHLRENIIYLIVSKRCKCVNFRSKCFSFQSFSPKIQYTVRYRGCWSRLKFQMQPFAFYRYVTVTKTIGKNELFVTSIFILKRKSF